MSFSVPFPSTSGTLLWIFFILTFTFACPQTRLHLQAKTAPTPAPVAAPVPAAAPAAASGSTSSETPAATEPAPKAAEAVAESAAPAAAPSTESAAPASAGFGNQTSFREYHVPLVSVFQVLTPSTLDLLTHLCICTSIVIFLQTKNKNISHRRGTSSCDQWYDGDGLREGAGHACAQGELQQPRPSCRVLDDCESRGCSSLIREGGPRC